MEAIRQNFACDFYVSSYQMSLHVGSLRRFGRGNHTKVLHRGGGLWSSLGAAVCSFSPLWEAPLCFLLLPARCRWCLASTSLHLSVMTHPSTKPFHSFLHVRQAHCCSGLRRQRGQKKTVPVLHNLVFFLLLWVPWPLYSGTLFNLLPLQRLVGWREYAAGSQAVEETATEVLFWFHIWTDS